MEPIINFILSCITTIIETFKNIKNNNSIIQIKVKTLFYKLFVMFDFGTPLNHEEKKASKYSELFNQSGEKARMLYRSKVYLLRQKKLTQEQLFNNYLTFLKNTIKEKSNDDVDITDIGSLVTVAEQQIFTDQNINHIISMIRKHLKDAAKLFANENYDMLINRATVIFIKNNFDDQCSLMQNLNRLPLLSGNEVLIFKILLFVRKFELQKTTQSYLNLP